MKWVCFTSDVTWPRQLKAWTILAIDDDMYETIKAIHGSKMLNVTPRLGRVIFDVLAGRRPFNDAPWSAIRIVPCWGCMALDRKENMFKQVKTFTRCDVCGDTRSMPVIF